MVEKNSVETPFLKAPASTLVSIIVPNYNHERYLPRRLDSILNQTFRKYELILMDDCSSDQSLQVIETYRHLVDKVVLNTENSGSTFKQWNKGIKEAKGKYIWIAESDDYAEPILLERLVACLENNSGCVAAYCHSWETDENDTVLRNWDFHYHEPDLDLWKHDFVASGCDLVASHMFIKNIVPNASAVLFRKDAYLKAGGADESYRITGDWKLWATLFLQGDVAFVAEPLNYFRTHRRNVRSATARNGISLLERLRVMEYLRTQVAVPTDVHDRAIHHFLKTWIEAILKEKLTWHASRKIMRQFASQDPYARQRLLKRVWMNRAKIPAILYRLAVN